MKYKWEKIKSEPSLAPFMGGFCNTPTGVMTDEGGEGQPFVVYHPGLNLTPEGEWIPAPGFGAMITIVPTPQIFQPEVDALKEKIHGLECERLGLISTNDKLERDCLSLSDRIGELMDRISSVEQWATQPCKNAELRLAQAHVLKLVRGKS